MGSKEMSANYERERAIMEGERNVAADRYFDARPQLDTLENGSIYDAGFTDAYRTQTAKIQALENDAARYQWLTTYLVGNCMHLDDALVACDTKNKIDMLIDINMQLSSNP
jgi:hypothetical protein